MVHTAHASNMIRRNAAHARSMQHAHLGSALVTENSVVRQMGHAKWYSTEPVTGVSGALLLTVGGGAATLAVAYTRWLPLWWVPCDVW